MQFKFRLASDHTGNEFSRIIDAPTFGEAIAARRQNFQNCESRREQYNDNGTWRDVPRDASADFPQQQ
jgi:hypothetical protein